TTVWRRLSLAAGLLLASAALAEEGPAIKTPQPANIQFINNVTYRGGTLIGIRNPEEHYQRKGAAPVPYRVGLVAAGQTATQRCTFNPAVGRWEGKKERDARMAREKGQGTPLVQTVVVEGSGATREKALQDAFRAAVRQVVGALVDAETLVKDDK